MKENIWAKELKCERCGNIKTEEHELPINGFADQRMYANLLKQNWLYQPCEKCKVITLQTLIAIK